MHFDSVYVILFYLEIDLLFYFIVFEALTYINTCRTIASNTYVDK